MNKYMHPRNPYKNRIEFKVLASSFPEFAAVLDSEGKLDFSNREHARVLTKCLLSRDYNLQIEFPPNSLSPSLTLKMNYLLWIEDLLGIGNVSGEVVGLDIGTGGAILFPVLGVKHFGWSMIGTEHCWSDVEFALQNVSRNKLGDQIAIVHNTNPNGGLFDPILESSEAMCKKDITFCMTNPPFYDNHEFEQMDQDGMMDGELMEIAGRKHEMSTEGGEVNFVAKIIAESHKLSNIKIFTAMLGRKKSANILKQTLKSDKLITSLAVSEFCQGRIMRWGLAWTFHPDIHLDQSTTSAFVKAKQQKKQNTPFVISLERNPLDKNGEGCVKDCVSVYNLILSWLKSALNAVIFGSNKVEKDHCVIQFKLTEPKWRNQRAQRRKEERSQGPPPSKKFRKLDPEIGSQDITDDGAGESTMQTPPLLNVVLNIKTEKGGSDRDNSKDHTEEIIALSFVCKEDSVLGRGGLYELVQYFRNRLS